jgi:hypothetical protein
VLDGDEALGVAEVAGDEQGGAAGAELEEDGVARREAHEADERSLLREVHHGLQERAGVGWRPFAATAEGARAGRV